MALIHVEQGEFNAEVLQTKGTVLVDFFAVWCGPCKMQSPVLEELAGEHPEIKICKVDVDEAMEAARSYGISSIPTLMVVRDGKVVDQVVGLQSKSNLKTLLGLN